jgi:transposase-like protein
VDAPCACDERPPERVNVRNDYRERPWDTRVRMIELAIPKLR